MQKGRPRQQQSARAGAAAVEFWKTPVGQLRIGVKLASQPIELLPAYAFSIGQLANP
jgi:hypothetical protein